MRSETKCQTSFLGRNDFPDPEMGSRTPKGSLGTKNELLSLYFIEVVPPASPMLAAGSMPGEAYAG